MGSATEQLLQAVLALPEEERQELTEALLEAQDEAGETPFDPAWLPEIQRRSAEIDAGAAQLTPWPMVRERVRERQEGRSRG